MNLALKIIMLAFGLFLVSGCTDYRTIPVSKIGKVVDSKGLSKETYQPGKRNIGFEWLYTKKLVLLDTSVETIPFDLKVRLSDNQDLGVQVLVKTQLRLDDKSLVDSMFTMITPSRVDENTDKISLTSIYKKLNEDLVRRTLVEVITPHTLESFQRDRKEINDLIEKTIEQRFKNTPLRIYTATINKVEYPKSYIDKANELKSMEMSILLKRSEEKAKREKLLEEEATIIIDQRVRLAKAETIRLENLKTAQGLNPMLLKYRQLELADKELDYQYNVDMKMAEAAKLNGSSVIFYPSDQKPNYLESRAGMDKVKK